MSIVQACADVEAAIGRARSLFGDASAPVAPSGATDLDDAVETAAAARARTVGLSGSGIEAYQSVVDRSVGLLKTAAANDRALATHMTTAAAVTQAGTARLDHIAAQTREISRAASGATTPAEERIIPTALRSQLTQTSQVVQSTQQKAAELAGHIRALQYPTDMPQHGGGQSRMSPDDRIVNPGDTPNGHGHIQAVDRTWKQDLPMHPAIVPRNPFAGDERFGHWENIVPPPYVGKKPPTPWTGHRSLKGFPGKGPAGSSGFYTPGGKTWADDYAPPFASLQEQYRFRISGEDYTSYTRTLNGQQQQWVQYSYEAQRDTQVSLSGPAWAPKGPNENTGELGGVLSGGLGGINPPPKIGPWQPITLPQIATLSAP